MTNDSDSPFASDRGKDYVKDYTRELIANLREVERDFRRAAMLTWGLGFVFLIAYAGRGRGAAVTVFGLRFEDLHPLLVPIPVITAWLFTSNVNNA